MVAAACLVARSPLRSQPLQEMERSVSRHGSGWRWVRDAVLPLQSAALARALAVQYAPLTFGSVTQSISSLEKK